MRRSSAVAEVKARRRGRDGGLAALEAARARIASRPEFNGKIANLDVMDRLIAKFGRSYADAYRVSPDDGPGEAATARKAALPLALSR